MICKFCKATVPDKSKYCSECGALLANDNCQKAPALTRKRNTIKIGVTLGILIIIASLALVFNIFGDSADKKIIGTWVRSSDGVYSDETITYIFNATGGEASYNRESQNYVSETSPFEWYITEQKDLIVLWSSTNCTKYTWNTDYTNYSLSTNPYSWYVKGDVLYLSSTAAEGGYYIFNRQGN